MIRVFSEKLRARIRAELNDLADNCAMGAPRDWAEYQRAVGKVEGLAEAEAHLLKLFEEYTSGDTLNDPD